MSFEYQDGSEKKLFQIFENPNFCEDLTWNKYSKDWSFFYHLSPERKNLLRWLDFDKKGLKILELGAGCGAITSYFTSLKSEPEIVAVEGSISRAELIKVRCKNYEKLKVVTSNIYDYNDVDKYDYVTLIGVLEYSGRYVDGDSPFLDIIRKASKFLKDDGVLIIAIENKLGHKYLAGYNEDHYGIPFEGVSDYPNYNGIKTFDKNELKDMISKVGLVHQQWYYPYPDYKLPKVILNDQAIITQNFDWLTLMDFPTLDYNSFNSVLFDERNFLCSIINNVDVSVFMNSFLVFASKSNFEIKESGYLASTMQFSYNPKFQTIKEFLNFDKEIMVKNKKYKNGNSVSEDFSEYYSGYKNILQEILHNFKKKNYKEVSNLLNLWFKILSQSTIGNSSENNKNVFFDFCKSHLNYKVYGRSQSNEFVLGNNIDLILRNLLIKEEDKSIKIIDQEWDPCKLLPLQYIIDRGMFYLQLKLLTVKSGKLLTKEGEWNLPLEIRKALPVSMRKPNIKSFSIFEYWFQSGVRGGCFDHSLSKKDLDLAYPSFALRVKNKIFILLRKSVLKIKNSFN